MNYCLYKYVKTFIALFVLQALITCQVFAQDNQSNVIESIFVLEDYDSLLSKQEAFKKIDDFKIETNYITLKENTGQFWIKLKINNTQDEFKHYILDLDYIFIEQSELFVQKHGELVLLDNIDISKSVISRNIVYRKHAYSLNLQPHENNEYLLRVVTNSTYNTALEIIPSVTTLSEFLKNQLIQNIIFFLLIGFFVSLAIYNAIIYLSIGEKRHIYYSLYLLNSSLIILCYEGLIFYFPNPPSLNVVVNLKSILPLMSIVFLISFAFNVLQIKNYYPRLENIYKLVVAISLIIIPLTLFNFYFMNIIIQIFLVSLIVFLGFISAILMKKGQKTAVYFLISYIFISIGYVIETTLSSIPLLEIMDAQWVFIGLPLIEQYFFYTCLVIEVLFMSLALSSSIDQLRIDRRNAKIEVHEQLQKTAKLKEDYALSLEKTVEERTAELIKQQLQLSEQNQKLIDMDGFKNEFLANISHEFRTPLTLIVGPVQKIISGDMGEQNGGTLKALSLVNKNSLRLSKLIEELLTLSQMESNNIKLNVQKIDVNSFCKRISAMFDFELEKKNITFEKKYLEKNCMVFFDFDRLESILINLLSNAFKYTPRNGVVKFEIEVNDVEFGSDNDLIVYIRDSGIGIPDNNKERVFDRFFRVANSSTGDIEGSGIGLALVKELVEHHGGSVCVEDSELGGCDFILKIPKGFQHYGKNEFIRNNEEEGVNFGEYIIHQTKKSQSTNLKSILIVEDVSDMREYIADHFIDGFNVFVASNGQQAWEILESQKIDVIVTDLMMPVMDGMTLLTKIRNSEFVKDLPVVFLSAKKNKSDRNLALSYSADDYIAKPFDSDELVLRVNNLITRKRDVKEGVSQNLKELSASQKLLEKVNEIIKSNINDHEFNVNSLAISLNISKPTLHRHLSKACNTTPAAYMRDVRLEMAHQLIEAKSYRTIAEVAYAVGFNNAGYFSRLYKQRFEND